MARTKATKEWIGANDDAAIPLRVRDRVIARSNRICGACKLRVAYGGQIDHVIALANWNSTPEKPHGNRESNLQLLCKSCHRDKTGGDVAEFAKVRRTRVASTLEKPKSRWAKRLEGLDYDWEKGRYVPKKV